MLSQAFVDYVRDLASANVGIIYVDRELEADAAVRRTPCSTRPQRAVARRYVDEWAG